MEYWRFSMCFCHIKKQRHYFANKGHLVKAMVFPVVMYGCESWTVKTEWQTFDAFKLWCWRTLESTLNSKEIKPVNPEGNQSWIFIVRTDAETEAPILWPPDVKSDSLEKTMMLGKLKAGGEGDNRGWDGWMALPTQRTWVWASSRRWWRTGKPGMLQSMKPQSHTWLNDWTTTISYSSS